MGWYELTMGTWVKERTVLSPIIETTGLSTV
jgi:hypothetical protein